MLRRDLLKAAPLALAPFASAADNKFTFVHLTDMHIQPELRAGEGCRLCIAKVNHLAPDFAINSGDLVFDAFETKLPRAKTVYDLYRETVKPLKAPLHHAIGNHDIFGIGNASGVSPSDPLYGKRMYEDRIGKLYHSFTHKGWHFIFLDSIAPANGGYTGHIGDEQLSWLASDLAAKPKQMPVVVVTHIPLVTGFPQYTVADAPLNVLRVTNAHQVLNLLWPHNLKAVLQGHTHVRETVLYNGCQFITSGAVCGNWWKGSRLGHPEGFGVLAVNGGDISWRYETYGFQAAG